MYHCEHPLKLSESNQGMVNWVLGTRFDYKQSLGYTAIEAKVLFLKWLV